MDQVHLYCTQCVRICTNQIQTFLCFQCILYNHLFSFILSGVVLTHAHFIADVAFLRWTVDISSTQNDVFLCFIPLFHIYGLSFFALGLFCVGTTTMVMKKYKFHAENASLAISEPNIEEEEVKAPTASSQSKTMSCRKTAKHKTRLKSNGVISH